MENKKQLVIIPPLSEALKKLNDVLEGISGDENFEISIIDDLKELSQFVATTGQCLILVSNAKKCAAFLQDNKSTLAKSHCKTILFTPKEIPSKTLTKFTKIGLTESILETFPPKTFLYKVKLQLRSIKTSAPKEESENVVKSLETAKLQNEDSYDTNNKENDAIEEGISNFETEKKKRHTDLEELLDYSGINTKKRTYQEEKIETNWKSDHNKSYDFEKTNEDEEEKKETPNSTLSNIDMYYRGKNKKQDITLEPDEESLDKLKKEESVEEESSLRKKSTYADVFDEGSMKQKKLLQEEENQKEESEKEKQLSDLDLTEGSNQRKKDTENDDAEAELKKHGLPQKEIELLTSKEKEEDKTEDLGGYLKGKISQEMNLELDSEPSTSSETEYDNSEIEEKENTKTEDLDLLAEDKKNRNKNQEETILNKVHDGQVDKIDGNLTGDSKKTKKEDLIVDDSSDDTDKKTKETELNLNTEKENASVDEEKNPDEEETQWAEELNLNLEKTKNKTEESEEEKEDDHDIVLNKSQQSFDLLDADQKKELPPETTTDEKERKKQAFLEKLKAEKSASANTTDEEREDSRSRKSSGLQLQEGGNQIHEGQVDKIDTFYRSGGSKTQDQDWNLLNKKQATEVLLQGQKKSGMSLVAAESKDYEEMTIDYRKLKEEFDMISSGFSSTDSSAVSIKNSTELKNIDDEDSFKVIEVDPKGLDFSIAIINSIYNNNIKANQIFALIAAELVTNYHCYPVFYSYKLSDNKFTEIFNSFFDIKGSSISIEKKDWWNEFKKDTNLFKYFQEKTMTTWRCPEIVNNNEIWEDIELPTWADQELKNKYIELIFPYFDGLDRMGLAVIIFPDGVNPQSANALLTILEMARSLFLDTIQRYQVIPVKEKTVASEESHPKELSEKKNILSFFSGLFGKKKAG